jgi:hypothetical protein
VRHFNCRLPPPQSAKALDHPFPRRQGDQAQPSTISPASHPPRSTIACARVPAKNASHHRRRRRRRHATCPRAPPAAVQSQAASAWHRRCCHHCPRLQRGPLQPRPPSLLLRPPCPPRRPSGWSRPPHHLRPRFPQPPPGERPPSVSNRRLSRSVPARPLARTFAAALALAPLLMAPPALEASAMPPAKSPRTDVQKSYLGRA